MRIVTAVLAVVALSFAMPVLAHGGGLNSCGCHFDRKTGECHCHRNTGCGCECQPGTCRSDASAGQAEFVLCKDTQVKGYTKKDGTYVEPHYRSAPNSTKSDNWSTKGNENPYTGKKGTKDPDSFNPYGSKKSSNPYSL